ncbi:helix-turn-helix transcriptional regulator [Caulobacter sp.]|uniref:helix-turn-helix domain-containing protein n=1 Tax=Caulobacter sp. TaxID=78 RepID=UPI001B08F058|nr:helix-turn-helix transcriptional regulator [Caulobacter sp.]MBO9543312.1 helix-turn-helix transcriptional regulator [Caulobacter sp.]
MPYDTANTESRRPSSIDAHVGTRVRMRRKVLGVTQDQLADSLHITFQQVQKYERGENRISASKLYQIASLLKTDIGFFFDGLPDPAGADGEACEADRTVQTFLHTAEGLQLAELFPRIGPSRVRRQLVDLVRVMAEG